METANLKNGREQKEIFYSLSTKKNISNTITDTSMVTYFHASPLMIWMHTISV